MKQKKYFILAAAAALFAACSSDDLSVEKQAVVQEAGDGAVEFDVYVSRGLTRAGDNGVIDDGTLQGFGSATVKHGFGVFGYYTDGESYSGITKPNFFYNQNVYYSSSKWTYSPVRYWPNEFGNDAISDQVDKVTLFAYAPWVDVEPLTGIVKNEPTTNIISMTRNNVTGDPFIRYSATMDPTNSTDLCYGVAAQDFTSSNSGVNVNNIKKGNPYKNVVKPGTDANSKIKFDFKHALAQLKVTIDAKVNDQTNGDPATTVQTDYSRIWVRSIIFEGITQNGALNLNSVGDAPEWYDINGANKITSGTLTVYDGLKDGKEPMEKAVTETPATFNADLIQTEKYTLNPSTGVTANTIMGVTKDEKPLFEGGSNVVFAIPTGEKMKVTIVYDVETVDKNLAFYLSDGETLGTTIENKITKTIDAFGSIKAGYCYNLKLHLGMRTVDFDAVVTGWQDVNAESYHPSNIPTFAISTTAPNRKSVVLPAASTDYKFMVSGLPVNSTPRVSVVAGADGKVAASDPTVINADASGFSTITITPTANDNTKIKNRGYIAVLHPTDNDNKVYLDFTQAPLPLKLGLDPIANAATSLTITVNGDLNTDLKKTNAIANGGTLEVFKNGVKLVKDDANGYVLNDGLTITLQGTAVAATGDVFTVYIQSGDATAESVTKTVN